MIITKDHPQASKAMIIDEEGNNLAEKYIITKYDTETQIAEILEHQIVNGRRILKQDGQGGLLRSKITLPGTELKFKEP